MSSSGNPNLFSKLFDALLTLVVVMIVTSVLLGMIAQTWVEIVIVAAAVIVVIALVWAVMAWWHRTHTW